MSYGATEDQIKKFTREKQREKAVKVFLKTIQPESDGEPVRADTIYKSPIKGLKCTISLTKMYLPLFTNMSGHGEL